MYVYDALFIFGRILIRYRSLRVVIRSGPAGARGVLDPVTGFLSFIFFACINILHVLTRGGQEFPRPTKIEAKIFQIGSMLAHFSLLGDFFSLLAGS